MVVTNFYGQYEPDRIYINKESAEAYKKKFIEINPDVDCLISEEDLLE